MPATILLADPDSQSRMDWEVLLRDQGYSVVAVASEVALLDSCSQVQPDLVLINSSLAEICGPDIDGRLKADPRNKLTPVILITGPPNTSSTSPPPIIGTDSVWGGSPSRWEVLNRLHSLLHIKSYIDEQAVSVITSLARSIEGRDPYAKGHGERTAALAVQLGVRLDMSEVELEVLRMAALIHDIGKLMLPDSILLKPGWLTLEERKLMEQHPIEGERICSPLKSLRDVLPIIRHHHERIDGSGYPGRLRRSLIPLGARVLQVVDIFDALTTDRAYRKSVMVPRALTLLSDEVDHGRLDGHLVRQLASLLIARPYSFAFERLGTSQDSQLG